MDESSFMIRDMIVKSGVEIAQTTVVYASRWSARTFLTSRKAPVNARLNLLIPVNDNKKKGGRGRYR